MKNLKDTNTTLYRLAVELRRAMLDAGAKRSTPIRKDHDVPDDGPDTYKFSAEWDDVPVLVEVDAHSYDDTP